MKPLFLLAGGLLLTGTAHAQLGLRAGGNLAGYTSRTDNYTQVRTGSQLGYQVGVFYQVPLSGRLALVPEVQFSSERKEVTQTFVVTGAYRSSAYQARLDYLSVPLLLRLRLGPAYVELGAQGGYLVGGHEQGTANSDVLGGKPDTYFISRDVTYRYRRFDAGPVAGVGVRLPAGLGLGVRAYQGLFSLTHDGDASTGHFYRQVLQASLTYQLPASR